METCRAHISGELRIHCRSMSDMTVTPGGMDAFLQAEDLSYFKNFKVALNSFIKEWKAGPQLEHTA